MQPDRSPPVRCKPLPFGPGRRYSLVRPATPTCPSRRATPPCATACLAKRLPPRRASRIAPWRAQRRNAQCADPRVPADFHALRLPLSVDRARTPWPCGRRAGGLAQLMRWIGRLAHGVEDPGEVGAHSGGRRALLDCTACAGVAVRDGEECLHPMLTR